MIQSTDKLILMAPGSSNSNFDGSASFGLLCNNAAQARTLHEDKMNYLCSDGYVEELDSTKNVLNKKSI